MTENLEPTTPERLDNDDLAPSDTDLPGTDEAIDAAERDVRISGEEGDDVPVTPPDQQPRLPDADGGDATAGESIDQRIEQENPEDGTAYGAPDSVLDEDRPERLGGNDPGSIRAEEDVLGTESGEL